LPMRTGILFCLIILSGCSARSGLIVIQGMTMGTNYSISFAEQPERSITSLQGEIDEILETINKQMSTYIDDSELSQINQSKSQDWLTLSPELYEVISMALQISHLTNGAYDITIGNLVNLWGFGPGEIPQAVPEDETINIALKTTGYEYIELQSQPHGLKKEYPDIYLDLSSIAKGYAVDRLYDYLEQQGLSGFLVDIGGEVKSKGVKLNGQNWRIGIEKPLVESREILRVITLTNQAMATSGDYRNYIVHNGTRYSHTIDPRTGHPVLHTLLSVSVLHESAMVADALATALLVMGPQKGTEFAEQNGIAAYFFEARPENTMESYSSQFSPYLDGN